MADDYASTVFNKTLADIDPDLAALVGIEQQRQHDKLILIPSESLTPQPVREALASPFVSVYAEGYPRLQMTQEDEELLRDFPRQLAYLRRYSDRRFYKGTEFVDVVECLAQRRIAQCFATSPLPRGTREGPGVGVRVDEIFVNVQPLSGAAANNAVYEAFVEPGGTVMGMALAQGGHLTHGSPFNRSGKRYRIVSYGVDQQTERLDYDAIMRLALEHKPRMIIAGYTSYPWAPDWRKFREIADAVGAILMADIAHTAGLVVGGAHPNPVGIADVVTFTTHKTICGPRAAIILTTDPVKAARIDNAVFPGEQGGPHVNKFAAIAVAFKIAQSEAFRDLQHRIVANARHLADALARNGLRICYGGTDTHLLVVDLNAVKTPNGERLKGEAAARILDLCDIVVNKNTIPGDESAADASGIRMGTPWVTQRGLGAPHMERLAELIAQVVPNIHPFWYTGTARRLPRGKIALEILEEVRAGVAELVAEAKAEGEEIRNSQFAIRDSQLELRGERAYPFLQGICTANLACMKPGESRASFLLDSKGIVLDHVIVQYQEPNRYLLHCSQPERTAAWLNGLSDGYILFDDDILRKVEGPVVVQSSKFEIRNSKFEIRNSLVGQPGGDLYRKGHADLFDLTKPYFIGQKHIAASPVAIKRDFAPPPVEGLRRTPLFDEHRRLGARLVPFAGWEMPVWYTSIAEEHRAVRQAAGLFDVGHMGVLEVAGEGAASFLDALTTNYVRWLRVGECQYTYLLDPDGQVIDDLLVYCRAPDNYMLIVNAVNAEKVVAWLRAVQSREVVIDRAFPYKEIADAVMIRDLKDASSGDERRVDLALQGPKALTILRRLAADEQTSRRLGNLRRFEFTEGQLDSVPAIISRTGYTGEEIGFEMYVHPDHAVALWKRLLEVGAEWGLKPTGLGARDSTRTEAGLPLYGHELAGESRISPIAAGYGACVKFHKPFFVGRDALLASEGRRDRKVVRFRCREKGGRVISPGDPVVALQGQRVIGAVTSCVSADGFQVGMAYVDKRYAQVSASIGIFPLARTRATAGKAIDALKVGDSVVLHYEAVIVSRFIGLGGTEVNPPEE